MAVSRLPVRNSLQCVLTPGLWQQIVREHNGHYTPKTYSGDSVVKTTKA